MGVSASSSETKEAGKIVHFPQGIPGFEDYTNYNIFHKEERDYSVYWLESVNSPKVTFTLVDPAMFGLHYTIQLTDDEEKLLGASDPNQLAVLMMLSKPENQSGAGLSANISGPLVINATNHLGLQKVLAHRQIAASIVQAS